MRRALTISLTTLLYISAIIAVSDVEDTATLKAMRYDAKGKQTRIVLDFDRKIDYEQISRTMLMEFKLKHTILTDFIQPKVDPSDNILKDFKLEASESENTVSLFFILHKPVKPRLFWLPPTHRPRLVIDLYPAIGVEGIAQNLQDQKQQTSEPDVENSPLKEEGSTTEPAKSETGEEWLSGTGEAFEPLSLSNTERSPMDSPDAATTVPPDEGTLPILPPVQSNARQATDTDKEPRIPPAEELRNTIIVHTDTPPPTASGSGWQQLLSRAENGWLYLQIPLDLFLLGGFVWLWLRWRSSHRLLRELAAHGVADISQRMPPSRSGLTASTESRSDFSEVLQEVVSEATELPPLRPFQQEAELPTKDASSAKRKDVQSLPVSTESGPRRPRMEQPRSADSDVSTEDMRQALAKISSEIEALMERQSASSPDEGGSIEDDEETVLEEDRSLKAVIHRMAHQGMNQAQIAQQLGLTQEEVALMLRIAS